MRVLLAGVTIDAVTELEIVAAVCRASERGQGGRIITPNVEILRLARTDPAVRAHLEAATYVVADDMPLVWASRLAGTPLPERIPGSSLIWSLSYHIGRMGGSIFLIGGAPDSHPRRSGAQRAAEVFAAGCPGLRIAGAMSPPYGFDSQPQGLHRLREAVVEAKPDLVFVGLGFPKQEEVIDALAPELPLAWFLGCGAAINFVAGDDVRAPGWMPPAGMRWVWRLARDRRQLTRRYLRHGVPFALRALSEAAASRWRRLR